MKKVLWIVPVLGLLFAACGGNTTKGEGADSANVDTTKLVGSKEVPDSTIYGTATDDFGMSTFAMVVDGTNDALYFDRGEATVSGGLRPGDRYAVTACQTENGPTLLTVINLSELERLTKDYRIVNGRLVIGGKSVKINRLDAKCLTGTAEDGTHIYIGQ